MNTDRVYAIKACRSCGSEDLVPTFDLGQQPFANSLLDRPDQDDPAYPLAISVCRACGLAQLSHYVDPELLFSHYVWVTGTSSTARRYAELFCDDTLTRIGPDRPGYVLEVASNDGTFLKPFQARGIEVLGVDPARNIVDAANRDGVPSRCGFFGLDEARAIAAERGHPGLVIARNVFPHVPDPHDFAAGIAHLVGDDGTAVIEFHDARLILEELHYDSIYHEHVSYFTATTFAALFARVGMSIVDFNKSPISGGSLVAFLRKTGRATPKSGVADRMAFETREGLNGLAAWEDFAERSRHHAAQLRGLVEEAAAGGRRVVGYGASARSSTLLNYCGLDHRYLAAIADQAELKQGKYTAGTHIPVLPPDEVFADRPDTVVLLAWNFRDEIEELLRTKYGFAGTIVAPLPNDPKTYTLR